MSSEKRQARPLQTPLIPAPPPASTDSTDTAAACASTILDASSAKTLRAAAVGSHTTAGSASSKRPLTTTDKDGNQLSQKKLRRLEKNRLSARECRRRKREATENLQRQINVLEGENLRLRLQLQIGQEAEETRTREQAKLTEEIDALLKSGASEAEIYAALESFKEKYADYGRDRRSAIEFHLRNVERLLLPTQTTSVVMRAMEGGAWQHHQEPTTSTTTSSTDTAAAAASADADATAEITVSPSSSVSTLDSNAVNVVSFPNTASSCGGTLEPKQLFQCLANHLGVTPEQAAALKDSRFVAQELDACLAQSLRMVKELRVRLGQTGQDLETEFNNVRNVLTPTQAAKFLVWVANNSAAMHMLNELWDRIYQGGSSGGGDNSVTMMNASESASTTSHAPTWTESLDEGSDDAD